LRISARIYAAREWYAQGEALFNHGHATTPAFIYCERMPRTRHRDVLPHACSPSQGEIVSALPASYRKMRR
jgi:hypothetical protein